MRYEFRIAILYKFFVYCDISIYRDTPTAYTSIQISIGLQTGNIPSCCGIVSIGGFRGRVVPLPPPPPLWSDFTEKGSFLAIFWLQPPLSRPKLMVHKSSHERLRTPNPPLSKMSTSVHGIQAHLPVKIAENDTILYYLTFFWRRTPRSPQVLESFSRKMLSNIDTKLIIIIIMFIQIKLTT